MTIRNLEGRKFGRWTVVDAAANDSRGRTAWNVRCDCGALAVRTTYILTSRKSKSCGCFRREARRTHGQYQSKAHRVWSNMIQRCTNPKDTSYRNYGARGIAVCERWLVFENFYADMGDPAPRMTIERRDNERGYSPENCCWATRTDNLSNRRTNVFVEIDGKRGTLTQWARWSGVALGTLRQRLKAGWPVERLLTPTS